MTLQFAALALLAPVTNIGRLAQFGALSLQKVGACLKALGLIARVARLPVGELAGVAQIAVVLAILADNARIVTSMQIAIFDTAAVITNTPKTSAPITGWIKSGES